MIKRLKAKKIFLYINFLILISNDLYAGYLDYIYKDRSPSYSIFGETGLITLPSAEILKEGSLFFSYYRGNYFKYSYLSISPFDWLEASYFYYRPDDLWWKGPGTEGKLLDKGFNIKINKVIPSINSHIAVGLGDFAGTGYFDREYIALTTNFSYFKTTAGLGWGNLAGYNTIKNPFTIIHDAFESRRIVSAGYNRGGSVSYDQAFRGPASPFLGLEVFIPKGKGSKLIIETNNLDFELGMSTNGTIAGQNLPLRERNSSFNFGFMIPITNNIKLSISRINGNNSGFQISFGANFSSDIVKKKSDKLAVSVSQINTNKEWDFYENIIKNINQQSIFLQSAELENGELKVAVVSSKYRNPIQVHALLGETVAEVQKINTIPIDTVTTVGVNVGHELHHISSPLAAFSDRENAVLELVAKESTLAAGEGNAYRSYEFIPTIKYPASFTGIAPALVTHIGDPAKFFFGGLVLRLDNEIQFSSRLQLNSEIHQNLANNFDEKRNFPDSLLPRVRTDIVSYLQESDTYISRMQLDYFFNPYKEVFGKFSAGILENMYAGAGVEFLYKPFEQNFSIGLEAYRAKKRAFDRKFELMDYEINTGHINFNYHLPQWGILGTLSYGKYLAGDEGYTFDISRRLPSGFRTGVFFTRTNVSAELFGEGSFDKGFYFQIPIDLFLNDYRGGYINFKLRPLTRDGGQKLEAGNDLIGLMHTTSRAEIERDWSSFND